MQSTNFDPESFSEGITLLCQETLSIFHTNCSQILKLIFTSCYSKTKSLRLLRLELRAQLPSGSKVEHIQD